MKKRYVIAFIISLIVLVLTYKFWLIFKSATSAKFDFYPFSIILILSCLGGLKLTNYFANFKGLQHKSKIEIIFLAIFFIFLFIPMSHINSAEKSETENRRLAVYKPLVTREGKINYTYGQNFDVWFNDRFNFRDELINIFSQVNWSLSTVWYENNKYVLNKVTHWGFIPGDIRVSNTSESFLNATIDQLIMLKNFCDSNNIKLYVIVVPSKAVVYYSELETLFNTKLKIITEISKINTINKSLSYNIIYPINPLIQASKNDYVFFKSDHHWTEYGAYIGYQTLMNEIIKDFPDLKPVNLNLYNKSENTKVRGHFNRSYDYGLTYSGLGLDEKTQKYLSNSYYSYYDFKDMSSVKITIDKDNRIKTFHYEKSPNNLKVLITGTSMSENLLQFLPYTFKDTLYLRLNNRKNIARSEEFKLFKYYRNRITTYNPDILILCITYGNLAKVKNLFVEDKIMENNNAF